MHNYIQFLSCCASLSSLLVENEFPGDVYKRRQITYTLRRLKQKVHKNKQKVHLKSGLDHNSNDQLNYVREGNLESRFIIVAILVLRVKLTLALSVNKTHIRYFIPHFCAFKGNWTKDVELFLLCSSPVESKGLTKVISDGLAFCRTQHLAFCPSDLPTPLSLLHNK